MSAPVATSRGTPSGLMLENGYRALITNALNPTVELWEKTVQPPAMDGGPKIDITTMHNSAVRTAAPGALIDIGDSVVTVAYDPNVYNTVKSLLNVKTTITHTFSDGSTLAYFGYFAKFEPDALEPGKHPEAKLTIVATNRDSSGAEQAPVLTSVAGT